MRKGWPRAQKHNPKAFYSYLGGKKANRVGVGPLKDDTGNIVTDDQQQAEIFNRSYASSFMVIQIRKMTCYRRNL